MSDVKDAMIGRQTLQPGEIIFREGSTSDRIYFIESGSVELQRPEGDGMVHVARLGPQNILGETALLENRVHSLRAVAELETTLVVLSNEPFLHALKQLDPAVTVIIAGMARKLEMATQQYSHLKALEEKRRQRREEDARAAALETAPPSMESVLQPQHAPAEYYSFPLGPASKPIPSPEAIAPTPHAPHAAAARPFIFRPKHKKEPWATPWQWAALGAVVVAAIYLTFAGIPGVGPSVADFRNAAMALDEAQDTQGRTVKAFLDCLANRGRAVGDPPNTVSVSGGFGGDFSVRANLRSDVIFHFLLRTRAIGPVAVLERVEYSVPDRGFAQAIDLEGKQLFTQLACE